MERSNGLRRCFATAAFVALTACGGHAAPSATPAPFVQTAVASFGTIEPQRRLAGVIAPYENVAVQSSLSVPADAVYVHEGDVVRAGQVLAVLDTADLRAQLQSDRATANSNHANTVHTVYQGGFRSPKARIRCRPTKPPSVKRSKR